MVRSEAERGALLVEVVLALLLLSFLVSLGWVFLAKHREVGLRVSRRAEALETIRTIGWVLGEETGPGWPEVDWAVASGDSLPLRAFRGLALLPAGSWSGRRARVCFRGHRAPAPEKDSVLLLGPDGSWSALDLEDRVHLSDQCPGMPGWEEEEWTLSQGRPGDLLARLFERGSYHLVNRALRYGRGPGGRQPLTPEILEEGRFLHPLPGGRRVRWEVVIEPAFDGPGPAGDPAPRTWRGGG